MRSFAIQPVLLILVLGASACDGLVGARIAGTVGEGGLTVVHVAPNAPPLIAPEASVWAVRGQEREVELRYEVRDGYNGKCLRFVIPADALLRHPDGRVVAAGDSVLISVRVVDPDLFLFEFEPAGLRFDPSNPARLEVRYRWMDEGQEIGADLGIWRQERVDAPWVRVPSTRFEEDREVHAEITSFTRFAVGFTRFALASD